MKVKSEIEVAQSYPTHSDPRTAAYQAPPSMGFSRQEYWIGLPFPSPGDLPYPGIKPRSPALQTGTLPSEPPGKCVCVCVCVYIYIYIYKIGFFGCPGSSLQCADFSLWWLLVAEHGALGMQASVVAAWWL